MVVTDPWLSLPGRGMLSLWIARVNAAIDAGNSGVGVID